MAGADSGSVPRDLTTPDYWGHCHSELPSDVSGAHAWLRARLRQQHDDLLCRLLDSTGKQRAHVLEVGCAPGSMLERMHRLRPQHCYAGIDYAAEALQRTRERLAAAGVEADLFLGDVRGFEPTRSFDLVVSFGLLEHFDDPLPMLRAHVRCATQGGDGESGKGGTGPGQP